MRACFERRFASLSGVALVLAATACGKKDAGPVVAGGAGAGGASDGQSGGAEQAGQGGATVTAGQSGSSASAGQGGGGPVVLPRVPGTASDDPDAGVVAVSFDVTASTGGLLELPDGASLSVPPGALEEDVQIIVRVPSAQSRSSRRLAYEMQPSGLRARERLRLRVPYSKLDGQEPLLTPFQVSSLNEVEDFGSEQWNGQALEILGRDEAAGTIDVAVEHFSVSVVLVQVLGYTYTVPEIPARYLKPGDLVFVLTQGDSDPGPNHNPGHVGVFVGGGEACGSSVNETLIESTPPAVRTATLTNFKSGSGHLYLGARRHAGGPLSASEASGIVSFCNAQLNKPYNIIGQGNVTNGSFSCVGLAEAAYDSVDRSILEFAEVFAPTPTEQYVHTRPVEDITMAVGENLSMLVRKIVMHPDSPALGTTLRGWYCDLLPCRSLADPSVTVDAQMEWTGTKPESMIIESRRSGLYLEYLALPEHVGQTYSLTFRTTAAIKSLAPLVGHVDEGTKTSLAFLRVTVTPCPDTSVACLDPADPAETRTACLVGGDEAHLRSQDATTTIPLAVGGTHPNSNLLLPEQPTLPDVDLVSERTFSIALDQAKLDAAFGPSGALPCGPGPNARVLCPPLTAEPSPGEWLLLQSVFGAPITVADPSIIYQLAFVLDRDGASDNDYVGSPAYAGDYFIGSDAWYSAEYAPGTGWELVVTHASGNTLSEVPSAARMIIMDNVLTLAVPKTELPASTLEFRQTAFRHLGDYGQNAPYDYSADTDPRVPEMKPFRP